MCHSTKNQSLASHFCIHRRHYREGEANPKKKKIDESVKPYTGVTKFIKQERFEIDAITRLASRKHFFFVSSFTVVSQ